MKVIAIKQENNVNGSIDVVVNIEHKRDLILNFQGADELPFLNDCIFLSLYIQSMQEGSKFFFPYENPISEQLIINLTKHQNIFCQWYKKELQPIEVDVKISNKEHTASGVVSLFSGGIDSYYTYVDKQFELTHVFLCLGLDIQLEEATKIKLAVKQYSEFAKENNKTLLIASTNMRHVFPDNNRLIQHAALFSALVLAYGLKTLYIPASHTINELFPWGSHLLTDPLLSNGITEVIHHGAIARTDKTSVISEEQKVLDTIRICNSSDEFNCGECEKCIRTMFALEVLNKHTKSLPSLNEKMKFLKKIKIYKNNQFTFWQDNYNLAIAHRKYDLAKYAKAIIISYRWRQWIKSGIALFTNKDS